MSDIIEQTIRTLLPPKLKTTSGGWLSMNAVCCSHRGHNPDTRARGGIRFEGGGFVWHCFNCGFSAGYRPGQNLTSNTRFLLNWLGLDQSGINQLALSALKAKDSQLANCNPELDFTLKTVELPPQSIELSAALNLNYELAYAALDYVKGRGLELDSYNWYISLDSQYKDRVVLPFYHNQQIVGYTARKLSEGTPRYLSNTQRGYVFNIDAQTYDREFVIVVEGQFDAISVGGVAVMCQNPNQLQRARINNLNRTVIALPDRDASGVGLIKAAEVEGWQVSAPPWEDGIKDANEAVQKYGLVYTLQSILNYTHSGKIKLNLLKNKWNTLYGTK